MVLPLLPSLLRSVCLTAHISSTHQATPLTHTSRLDIHREGKRLDKWPQP